MSQTKKKDKPQDHDLFMKAILGVEVFVKKILLTYLDKKIIPFIDFDTLKMYPTEHIDKRLRGTHSDVIHECAINRQELPVSLQNVLNLPNFRFIFVWEHKSSWQKMPIDFQLNGYIDNIHHKDFEKNVDSLSVILPIIIYHGKDKWEKKRLYDYFQPYLPDTLLEYIPKQKLLIIDIQAMSDADIENALELEELRSGFIALKYGHESEFFKKNMKNVFKFVNEKSPKELLDVYISQLFEYMQRRSKLDNEKFQAIVEQQLKDDNMAATTFKTIFQTAREEGKLEGELLKARTAVINILKKGILSIEQAADILEVPLEFVKNIQTELVKNPNLK